jgi:GNAT superfamily N-acetyltransferase
MVLIPLNTKLKKDRVTLFNLDAKIFPAGDCFDSPDDWADYDGYLICHDGCIVGSMGLLPHADFDFKEGEIGERGSTPGCLYAVSLGILPEFRGRHLARYAKQMQIFNAGQEGFMRIVSYPRSSNSVMRTLNTTLGFSTLREIPGFYETPDEAAMMMQLDLPSR